MNFKVNKYQTGGLIAVQSLPFQSYPTSSGEETTKSKKQSSSSSDDDDSKLADALLKQMVGKAITNDVMQYKSDIDNAYLRYEKMGELERNSFEGRRLKDFISGRDFSQISRLQRSKELFDKAIETVEQNKSYDEVAVTTNGVIAMNQENGNIENVNLSDYAKDISEGNNKYKALTNAELINLREVDPRFTNNNNIFSYLQMSKGMPVIKNEIDSYLTNIGKSIESSSTNQFVKGNNQKILNSVQEIQKEAAEGVFDVQSVVKKSTNDVQLKTALESIWSNLSDSSKQVLKARAAKTGVGPQEIDKTAKGFIALMVAGRLDTVEDYTTDIKYNSDLSKAAKGTSASDDMKGTEDLGPIAALAAGALPIQKYTINPGSNYQYSADASVLGTYRVNGEATGPQMLSDMPDIMSIVDKKNVSAGESPISFENLGAVMYDGSNIANVELPVRYVKDSNNVTRMVPDSKLSKRIEEAQKEIDSLKVKDINTIREIYAAHDIETNYQGKPIYKYQKFLIFDAVVGEEVLDESNIDNSFFEDVDNEMTKNIFNQRYEYGSKSATKTNKRSVPDRDKYWLLPGQKALKKTQVALPISDITVNAAFADRNKLVIPKSQRSVEYMRENAAQQTGTRTMNEPSKTLMVSEDILNNE